jgi:hypothetical protein
MFLALHGGSMPSGPWAAKCATPRLETTSEVPSYVRRHS